MKTIFSTLLAGHAAQTALKVLGNSPLMKLGAASLAARVAAASLPLTVVMLGAGYALDRYIKRGNSAAQPKPATKRPRSRKPRAAAA